MPSETVTSLKECGLIVVVINAFFAMICDVIQVAILLVVIADSNFKFSDIKNIICPIFAPFRKKVNNKIAETIDFTRV